MKVLLLGGSSSVGKTTAAREIAGRTGAAHVELRGPRFAHPALNPLGGGAAVFDRPAEALAATLVQAAEVAAPILLGALDDWLRAHGRIVVEGERVHPSVVKEVSRRGLGGGALIVEGSADRLHETLMLRSRSFAAIDETRRRCVAEVGRLYGAWVRAEAERRDCPWVASQPWETLVDRILEQAG